MSTRNSMENEGEGAKTAARRYNEGALEHARSGRSEAAARDARAALDSGEAQVLRQAAERGKAAAVEEDPEIDGGLRLAERPELAAVPAPARPMAVRRAAELIAEGCQIGRACRMAATAAQAWLDGGLREAVLSGPAQHVMFEYDAWLICPEDRPVPTHAFDRLSEALATVEDIAAQRGAVVYLYDADGELREQYESYGGAFQGPRVIHVLQRDGQWVLARTGDSTPLGRFDARKSAIGEARARARGERSTVVVHHEPEVSNAPEPLDAA